MKKAESIEPVSIPDFIGICWPMDRSVDTKGYARFWHKLQHHDKYTNLPMHRVVYLALRGPIPDGFVIDHLCRVRNCQNPWHMEAVANKVNVLRGVSPAASNHRKTHCECGLPLELWGGRWACPPCARKKLRSRYNPEKRRLYRERTGR